MVLNEYAYNPKEEDQEDNLQNSFSGNEDEIIYVKNTKEQKKEDNIKKLFSNTD